MAPEVGHPKRETAKKNHFRNSWIEMLVLFKTGPGHNNLSHTTEDKRFCSLPGMHEQCFVSINNSYTQLQGGMKV